jgi:uncharacterized integral membrane protein
MTYFRYALLAIVLLLAVMVALANSAPVTLSLWPEAVAAFVGREFALTLPLFVVVGGAVGLGLVLGLIWEWLRERSIRREAGRAQRELAAIQRAERATPVPAVRRPRDDILEIVDEANTPR